MLQGLQPNPFIPIKKETPASASKALIERKNISQSSLPTQKITSDQFIRSQPVVQFSGRAKGSTTIQADKEKKVQLEAKQVPIQIKIDQKNAEIKPYTDIIDARDDRRHNRAGGGSVLATIAAGAGAGAKMGFVVDAAAGGTTFGATTVGLGALGGFFGLLSWPLTVIPALVVSDVFRDNTDLDPQLKPLLQQRANLHNEMAPINTELYMINTDLEQATETMHGLEETEVVAKTAIDEKAFQPKHFHHIKDGLDSVYIEINEQSDRVAKLCKIIPGFRDAYKHITQDELGKVDLLDENKKLLKTGTDSERATALRRIYRFEKAQKQLQGQAARQEATISYVKYAHDPEHFPELALTALHILAHNPELGSKEAKGFRKAIEHALASHDERLINAGLDAVLATNLHSGTINYHLNRIANRVEKFENPQIKAKAEQARLARLNVGTYREFDPDAAVDNLMRKMVGNAGIVDVLQSAADNYQSATTNYKNKMPALKLYLNGASGIGKTSSVHNIHEEFQNDHGEGLIKIHFGPNNGNNTDGPIDSAEMLVDRLRQAAPLQGKTIFLDEFTDLLQLPDEQQRAIGIRLRQLFDTERIIPGQQHLFKAATGIDPHNVILAVATNRDLDDVRTDERGNPITDVNGNPVLVFSQLGAPAISRIKGGAHEIELQRDLTDNIGDFVRSFVPSPYFREIADINWKGNIVLTPAAQEHLIRSLTDTARSNPRERSGRALKDRTANILNNTIAAYKNCLNPTERETRVHEPITISLGERNRFIAQPQNRA